jgi:hypothetical protein
MVSDVVALVFGSTDDVRVLKSMVTPKEERCLDLGSCETTQNPWCVFWVGAVVKSKCNGTVSRWPVNEIDSPR